MMGNSPKRHDGPNKHKHKHEHKHEHERARDKRRRIVGWSAATLALAFFVWDIRNASRTGKLQNAEPVEATAMLQTEMHTVAPASARGEEEADQGNAQPAGGVSTRALLSAPAMKGTQTVTRPPGVPSECQAAWSEIAALSLQEFEERFRARASQGQALEESDEPPAAKATTSTHGIMPAGDACLTLADERSGGQARDARLRATFLRAHVVDALMGTVSSRAELARWSDSVLANALVSRLSSGFGPELGAKFGAKPGDPSRLEGTLLVAEELAARQPEAYSVHKAKAMVLLSKVMATPRTPSLPGTPPVPNPAADAADAAFDAAIATCRDFGRDDPELREAGALRYFVREDSEGAEGYVRSELAAHPDWPGGHYHLAGIAWRKRETAGAKNHLDRALALSPGETRFLDAVARIATATPGEKGIFHAGMSVGFSDL